MARHHGRLKGAYKRRPNNPRTADGTIHEYCPPEHTPSEMERLIGMHHEHERARRFPAPLEAAWLHHRFVQIHPFEDGNGRTARLLMSYVFARRGEPTPVITALEKPRYFDALQEADRGDLRTFVRMLERKAIEGLESAAYGVRKMLEGRHEYFHMNGNLSASSPGNGWTRHRGTNGRESVIDIGAGGGETPGSVGKNGEKGTV